MIGDVKLDALVIISRDNDRRFTRLISLNVDVDLSPFSMINPCGYSDLEVTQLKDLGINDSMENISTQFQTHFERLLDKPAP